MITLIERCFFFCLVSASAKNGPGKALRQTTPLTTATPKHLALQTSSSNPVSEMVLLDLIFFS